MKIAYDISVLGLGHYHKRARTGVFRVVEKMAYGLLNAADIELVFYASQGGQNTTMCQKYLEENAAFRDIQFHLGVPDSVDILHSPFHAIQNNSPEIAKFLTVYDLIPVIFPQYFETGSSIYLKDALTKIKSDGWAMCISHSTKNDLCNYVGIHPSRVFVSHLAADPLLFYPCKDLDRQKAVRQKYHIPDEPYLLSVSTLEPRKNIDHVIRCFVKVISEEKIKDLNLVLVGTKGWDYDKIFREIESSMQYKGRIIVTDYVVDSDLASLYSGAFAFAYLSHYEGFGLPPLEAMQCGVPVITSNTSSLPEVVGDSGILLEPNDEDALCQEILKFYQSSDLHAEYSCKSIMQAQKFSWDKCIFDMLSAYQAANNNSVSSKSYFLESPKLDFLLIIDGVYFQFVEKNDPIKIFWADLLKSCVEHGFAQNLLILDRGGTAPWCPGVSYQLFPLFDPTNLHEDCKLLQQICNYAGADLFLSTLYTSPLSTPSVEAIYDFLPNLLQKTIPLLSPISSNQSQANSIATLVFSENMYWSIESLFKSTLGKAIYNFNLDLFNSRRGAISSEDFSRFKSRMIGFTLPLLSRKYNYIVFPNWKCLTEDLYIELKELLHFFALHPERPDVSLVLVVDKQHLDNANEWLGSIAIELFMEDNLEVSAGEEIYLIEPLKNLQWQLFLPKFQGWLTMQNSSLDKTANDLLQNLPRILIKEWY